MAIEFYNEIKIELQTLGFEITNQDLKRPWGAFFYINENQVQEFSDRFFGGLDVNKLKISGKLSPKILIVKPNVKLSWQYHNRRAEIWQVYKGIVGVIQSPTDKKGPIEIFNPGDQIKLQQGIRHRLLGLNDFGVVAEIWQHTDKELSDEDDITRVQDDFGRK
jgi:mannose-6-phosphate isomerase-like protein (cupin superfamily)